MVKGNQMNQGKPKYVGLTKVEIKAVNPTRSQLNKLLGKEDEEDEKEIEYLSTDQDGNERVRLSFWMYDHELDNYFVHSFNLTNKPRLSRDGVKHQYINNTCVTAWCDEPSTLPSWFLSFQDRSGEEIAKKQFREALLGEEELGILLRAWLGRMIWNSTECSVLIDTEALFKGDYSELQSLINSDFDTQFVVMTGVRTDENDPNKQYQQVWGKAFLPKNILEGIKGFSTKGTVKLDSYMRKIWDKFVRDIEGDYGFSSFFVLDTIQEYDKAKDISASPSTKVEVTPVNSKY